MGYAAQQNEFSYHMILGSNLIFNNGTGQAGEHVIFPFILDTQHRRNGQDNLRAVKVPDVCLMDVMPPGAHFSMATGEFVQVYEKQVNEWDAVVTCFFIDTAKNIFLYIRTMAIILRSSGVWVNFGPLLFHYADSADTVSIELSWEEVRPAICKYFDIVTEKVQDAIYTSNSTSLKRTCYKCILFTAVRNDVPVSGTSKEVF